MRILPILSAVILTATTSLPGLAADFTLIWEPVTGASHYQVQEKLNGVWGTVVGAPATQTSTTFTVSGRNSGTFTFRVGGCVEEPGVTIHCGEQVAVYSNELTVDASQTGPERRVIFIHTDLLGNPAAESN